MTNHALTTVALPPRAIQDFLEERDSVLATHTVWYKGKKIPASTYIYKMSKKFQINPEVMLTLAAKESSATEISQWTDAAKYWTLGYAVCDSCTFDDAADFRGFKKQMRYGTQQFRLYLETLEEDNRTIAGWGVGVPKKTFDNIKITPKNAATASHYSYTPWVGVYDGGAKCCGGNSLFQRLWQLYDFDTRGKIQIPRGVMIQEKESGDLYMIKNNRIHPISKEIQESAYSFIPVAVVSKEVIEDQYLRFYKSGKSILFPDMTIVQNEKNEKYYLIIQNKKFEITESGQKKFGYDLANAIRVPESDIWMKEGEKITEETLYPNGAFIISSDTEKKYFYDPFTKKMHPFAHEDLFSLLLGEKTAKKMTTQELESFDVGETLFLPDGSLVRTTEKKGIAYIADKGTLIPFASKKALNKHGIQKKRLTISSGLFEAHTIETEEITAKKKEGITY